MWGRRTLAVKAEYADQGDTYVKPVLWTPGGDEDRRSLHITLTGTLDEQREAAAEMATGYRCANCIEPLPEPPSVRAVPAYREAYGKNPGDLLDAMLARCAAGCCPFCGWEVRGEMAQILDAGTVDT